MTSEAIQYREENNIAIVTLARPEKLNALTPEMLKTLEVLADKIEAGSHLRAVILTAQGKAFCVGADITVWGALEPLDMWRDWVRNGHRVFDRWARLRQPTIAALNGHAFGGGLELAITADVRIAAKEAAFALPEASIATCPGWSGTQRLVRQIGAASVKHMALTGLRVDTQRALVLGLIQQISTEETLFEDAMALAERIAALAPISAQMTKQLVNAAGGEGHEMALEALAGALAATTHDAREGIASFCERRKARFIGS